jgi:transglycosylase-like protein with SLT domain
MSRLRWRLLRLLLPAILVVIGGGQFAFADGVLDRVTYAVDGAESSHGGDPGMWRAEPDGPQGPMQVSAAAAVDAGGGDRFDESENRALGRAYLARMFRRYRTWPDAIAAYNWGPGHLDGWINGGRAADKFPATVERYRNRVLVYSGLAVGSEGGDSFSRWANSRLSRLERLRLQAKRELAERLRGGRGRDVVQLLYAEIMRSTTPSAP